MLIKRIDKTSAEIKMYGSIGGWFVDGFNFTSILDELEASGCKEATFRMHCFGGSVFEGNVIGGAFARSKMKIKIVIDGIAASMAAMILPTVPVENISIAENGFGMIHRPSGGGNGDAQDHLEYAKLLLDMEGNFIRTLAQRTGKPADEIKKKFFDGKDHWLNADEMIEYRLAGSKITAIASIAELDTLRITTEQMNEESVYGHFAAKLENIDLPKNNEMKKELIETFALEGVTAESSDTAVLAAMKAKYQAQEQRLTALENKEKTEKTQAIKAKLDAAEASGKLAIVATATGKTAADVRAEYKTIAEANGVAMLDTILAGIGGAKQPITSHITGGKGPAGKIPDGTVKTWAWYQENDQKALENMPVDDPETFKALYKAEYGVDPEV